MRWGARLGAILLPLALLAEACGSSSAPTAAGPPAARIAVPAALGGLAARQEPAATKKLLETARVRDTYAADGVVYGLRLAGELMGVLELVHLNADARPDDRDFRREIVGQMGGSDFKPRKVGDRLVYRVPGNRQVIYVWFFGAYIGVLIARADRQSAGKFDPERVLAAAVAIRA